MAAPLKGDSVEESNLGGRHRREAQRLSSDSDRAPLGGQAKRMKEPTDVARDLDEIREFMDSGRKLNILRQADLSLPCVSLGLRCRGHFCDLNMLPRCPQRN